MDDNFPAPRRVASEAEQAPVEPAPADPTPVQPVALSPALADQTSPDATLTDPAPVEAPQAEPIALSDLPEGAEPSPYQPVMERPHPLTPVIKGWMGLVGMVFILGREVLENVARSDQKYPDLMDVAIFGGMLAFYFVVTAIFGFFSWRFTRFVIDDRQVRIERNFISHNSDKVPFTKIQSVDVVQPFAARLLGLAQLRIDVGSGSGKSIDYLTRNRAYQMRDYLVARAHGQQITVAESSRAPVGDRLNDLSTDEQVLLTVPPQRLVLAAILSTNFLVTILLSIAAVSGLAWTQEIGGAVGLIPLVTALVTIIGNNVVKQWNFRLVRSGQALKVSRGMTSLVSQTLPTNRVQGISITQHLGWRPFGLHRVRIDVLGYGGDEDEGASDVLLPAGTWAEVETALEAVWPGFRLDQVAMQPAAPNARKLHPFIHRSLQWGFDQDVFVARNGGFVHATSVVHHARVQSVHLMQGPLQRRLGLADVKLDTTAGILSACVAHELDETTARQVVLEQMDRCSESRRRDAERRALDALPAPVPSPFPETSQEATMTQDPNTPTAAPPGDGDDWLSSGSTTVITPVVPSDEESPQEPSPQDASPETDTANPAGDQPTADPVEDDPRPDNHRG